MAYVDLNPVRAAMAAIPEQSDYTSIKLRIEHWRKKAEQLSATVEPRKEPQQKEEKDLQPESLMPFVGNPRQPMPFGLAYNLLDYVELLDWTGRVIRDDKRGSIPEDKPSILQRLDITPEHWLELSTHFEDRFKGIVGSIRFLKEHLKKFRLVRLPNRSNSQ